MKSVNHLLESIKGITAGSVKTASADPTKLPDPDEKGAPPIPGSDTEIITPPGPDKATTTDTDTTPTDPKIESNGGAENPCKLAGAAAQANATGLLAKLANACKTDAPAAPAEKDKETEVLKGKAEEAGVPVVVEKSASTEHVLEGDMASQIVQLLVKSASGRQLLNDSLNEVVGVEVAADLLKQAAAQGEQAEIEALQARFQEVELLKQANAYAQEQSYLEQAFGDLTKEASAEDLDRIEKTAAMVDTAAAQFADNPEALEYFNAGLKVAAAMMQGAPTDDLAGMEQGMGAALPEGGEAPSLEEIAAAIDELVQSGEITPEIATALIEAIIAESGGGAPAAGGAEDPMQKAASAADPEVSNRLNLVNQIVDSL